MTTADAHDNSFPEIFAPGDPGYDIVNPQTQSHFVSHPSGHDSAPSGPMARIFEDILIAARSESQQYHEKPGRPLYIEPDGPAAPTEHVAAETVLPRSPNNMESTHAARQLAGFGAFVTGSSMAVLSGTKYHENHELYGGTTIGLVVVALAGIGAMVIKGKKTHGMIKNI